MRQNNLSEYFYGQNKFFENSLKNTYQQIFQKEILKILEFKLIKFYSIFKKTITAINKNCINNKKIENYFRLYKIYETIFTSINKESSIKELKKIALDIQKEFEKMWIHLLKNKKSYKISNETNDLYKAYDRLKKFNFITEEEWILDFYATKNILKNIWIIIKYSDSYKKVQDFMMNKI